MTIPVIDLFSGPGGLGEGFSSFNEGNAFRILVSAEMDEPARETLRLRSYFKRIKGHARDERVYYDFCNGVSKEPWSTLTANAWREAGNEACHLTLGTSKGNNGLDTLLSSRLKKNADCVVIGGPPCQAYSLVGRARNKGKADYSAENDARHFLYREYLRVIQLYRPAVFVMENVKGILSSQVGGKRIFHEILNDLVDPNAAIAGSSQGKTEGYKIYSLVSPTVFERGMDPKSIDPRDFIVRTESYGIPQARHRVILLGVREDIKRSPGQLAASRTVNVLDAIGDLPTLRSRLSDRADSASEWAKIVKSHLGQLAMHARSHDMKGLATIMDTAQARIRDDFSVGALRFRADATPFVQPKALRKWFADSRLEVFLNHQARGHMRSDLRRYVYAAAFARWKGRSPKGHGEFQLHGLAPAHANWESGKFADRFRVQLRHKPSTTITSHISKDGHYFIHPVVEQCRSLTVREAARLQTFPDNYFFQGNRTQQFHQVGNAVPPSLARQIARIVFALLG